MTLFGTWQPCSGENSGGSIVVSEVPHRNAVCVQKNDFTHVARSPILFVWSLVISTATLEAAPIAPRRTFARADASVNIVPATAAVLEESNAPKLWVADLTIADRDRFRDDDAEALGRVSLLLTSCCGIGLLLAVLALLIMIIFE